VLLTFIYQHSIDKTVYQELLELIEDEIALAPLEPLKRNVRRLA